MSHRHLSTGRASSPDTLPLSMAMDFSGMAICFQWPLPSPPSYSDYPILAAAKLGDLSTLKNEIKKGIERTDFNGIGAFHIAAFHGNTDILSYLIEAENYNPDLQSEQGRTPIFYAAQAGKIDTMTFLVDRGADPKWTDRFGNTPLHYATESGHYECIEYLLSIGVPVDPESYCGTPLHVAARYSHKKSVEILLEHNADINKVSNEFFTPLLMSISGIRLNCFECLIKAGADVNLCCPLVAALRGPNPNSGVIEHLLKAGANPNIRCQVRLRDYEMLPIEVAAECGKKRFVEMLIPKTTQIPTVPNWNVEGIIEYCNSPDFKEVHENRRMERFSDLKGKADGAYLRREYLMAIQDYTKAVEMAPTNAALYANRSMCWLDMCEGDLAFQDAKTAQYLRPDWPKAHYCLGAALNLLQKYEEACQVLLDGFELDPANNELD